MKSRSYAEKSEYGDFQTSLSLATRITETLAAAGIDPEVIIEPTCGKGAFLLAALESFRNIKKIIAVELHEPYVLETRQKLIQFAMDHPHIRMPEITVEHANVFDFDFTKIGEVCASQRVLILGNPPWVTNSAQGIRRSANLPAKSNFKNHSGLDAITGKGNFDIAESIALMMLTTFENIDAHLALLIKDSVIRSILFDQRETRYQASDWKTLPIDAKKEFNASVKASVLTLRLNRQAAFICTPEDFNGEKKGNAFGWVNNKFVSEVDGYLTTAYVDGKSPLEWRQGVKHDCSQVMEFEKKGDYYTNGLSENLLIEEEIVYGILKSSDLKKPIINKTRKYTIITQSRIGQDTSYIENDFPKAFGYLQKHKSRFNARKSAVYRSKPSFSIFGIGDYSFKPYKVSISGLYKSFVFNLILPQDKKPVMLDDTCYFIGFDNLLHAVFTAALLNSAIVTAFLQSITFSDAKRTFTKEALMRIDLVKVATSAGFEEVDKFIVDLSLDLALAPNQSDWSDYLNMLAKA